MKVRALVPIVLALVTATIPATAQTCPTTALTNTLVCTLPQLFGKDGLLLPNTNHSAHFQEKSKSTFQPVNLSIGEELSTLPLGSSGSGTTFTLDSAGRPVPTVDSLGPILTERATVIGRKAYQVGVAYQYFSFGEIDGLNLHKLPIVLNHELKAGETVPPPSSYENDYIKTTNQINLALNQTVIYGVIGITNRMDATMEVPINAVHFRVTSAAHIVRTQPCENSQQLDPTKPNYQGGDCTGTLDPTGAGNCGEFHYFTSSTACGDIFNSVDSTFPADLKKTDATGIGDIIIRSKYEVIRGEKFTGSIGIGFRFPSGDANNFLGSGAYGVAPFGAITYRARLSPHARIGYQWNSNSLLSGTDPTSAAGSSASLPPEFLYEGGADYRATKWFTVTADLIGESVLSASRLYLGVTPPLFLNDKHDEGTVQTIQSKTGTYNSDAIGIGGKVILKGQLLLIGNVTMRINSGGLHASAVPLVGLSYAF